MLEKQFQSLFTKWVEDAKQSITLDHTFVYELKITKTNKLEYNKIKPHQIPALLETKHGRKHHKISDQSMGYKPFDGFHIHKSAAYLIILFYKPQQTKVPIWIDVDKFVEFQKTSKYKYITEEQAKAIGISFGGI